MVLSHINMSYFLCEAVLQLCAVYSTVIAITDLFVSSATWDSRYKKENEVIH